MPRKLDTSRPYETSYGNTEDPHRYVQDGIKFLSDGTEYIPPDAPPEPEPEREPQLEDLQMKELRPIYERLAKAITPAGLTKPQLIERIRALQAEQPPDPYADPPPATLD